MFAVEKPRLRLVSQLKALAWIVAGAGKLESGGKGTLDS
jgi:hypothetical protein